ncbi:hypothetical protein [Sphingobacterium sp. UBA2074]|uniref:hypothetical protein n=1 Tax=Sphingobacterium sp. UBA2074 TaxID=1947487 RepID=UPI00257EB755|nr:hypothetical protein [Sphingobacterium sp. UBA2074]
MNTDQNVPEWGKELIKGFADLTKLVAELSDKKIADDKSKESEDESKDDDQELPDLEFNVTI